MSMGGQGTKWHRNITENFNRLSSARTLQTTDRRPTGGRAMTYSVSLKIVFGRVSAPDALGHGAYDAPCRPVVG